MSLLDTIEELDGLIRLQEKVESKLRSGQIIDAWREIKRIIATLQKERKDILEKEMSSKNEE